MDTMGIIARDKRQLTLIYSSNTRVGKHTLSYLTGLDGKYLAIDLVKTKVSDTQWAEIAEALNTNIGDLVDTRELDLNTEDTAAFGPDDWIKIIQKNDFVISRPIAIKGERTKQISNPPEIMEFFETDSAAIDDRPPLDTE
ncbi:hypothetical protein [Aequorivita sp. Q41]|uniref:arsenate reductase family protein n=1 Tax=Aequorivita sp. Q41 TaxID=3153300 RepID=UPI003242EDE4